MKLKKIESDLRVIIVPVLRCQFQGIDFMCNDGSVILSMTLQTEVEMKRN